MPECGNHIGPETRRIVVQFIKREPRDLASTLAGPGR